MTGALDSALETVREMLAREVPFEHMEAYIENHTALDAEQRSVLWLYAWCGGQASELRSIVTADQTPA